MEMAEEETKSFLILQTSGLREPKRTYAPLYIATAAAAMDMKVSIWFTMEGVTQLRKGAAAKVERIEGSGVTLKTWPDRARDARVEFLVCAQAMEAECMGTDDIIDGCDVTGAASIVDMSLEVDRVMYF